jgi:outer membrane protein OmpA-like peptidoglycan-associated protein
MSDRSAPRIVGHTDMVDCPDRNQELSEFRAKNVRQALQDILGNALKVPQDKITVEGLGEIDAALHTPPRTPERPDLRFSRVELLLNGSYVLVLGRA